MSNRFLKRRSHSRQHESAAVGQQTSWSFWKTAGLAALLGVVVAAASMRYQSASVATARKNLEVQLVAAPLMQFVERPCDERGAAVARYLILILDADLIDTDAVEKYKEVIWNLKFTCQLTGCRQIRRIKKAGWLEGDKNEYCRMKQYDGVWNGPNRDYSSGGYCYKGEEKICRDAIEDMLRDDTVPYMP